MQNLTRLIPLPVIGVYINYSFAMLKGAEALFNTVEKYADRIVAEVAEVDKVTTGSNLFNKNSILSKHLEIKAQFRMESSGRSYKKPK